MSFDGRERESATMRDTEDHTVETDAGRVDLTEYQRAEMAPPERRVTTMEILAGRTAPVALEDLATLVAAKEGIGTDIDTVDRVALTLHHTHLPRLAELDILDYDPVETRVVSCPKRELDRTREE
ncbi:hypothetical protein BRD00_13020 [Halobacteriales archaeon QS_8_69_26]|nr:MAG: hypothetical protein BRD00_13020 [Halobacteriales archaeon QS_8_69_26]